MSTVEQPTAPVMAAAVAVVVTRGVTPFLGVTLQGLAEQRLRPAAVIVVDVAASAMTAPAVAAVLPLAVVVKAPSAGSFGQAVSAALADDQHHWWWLLHDDSAPAPDALRQLAAAVERAPSVVVAGCKQVTWADPDRLIEVGSRTTRSGRRFVDIDADEIDQGQHDGRDDQLAVGTAGALVRADVWRALGGPDPALGPFLDGLDLCRRARLAGHRVIVVPGAVVRHARASFEGLRGGNDPTDDGDRRRSFAARRVSLLHLRLTSAPTLLLPFVAVMAVAAGVLRAMGRIARKEPTLVAIELLAPVRALGRPAKIMGARRRARRTATQPRRSLRPLQASWREVWARWRDVRLTAAAVRKAATARSDIEERELAAARSRRRVATAALTLVLVTAVLLRLGDVVSGLLKHGRWAGGGLPDVTAGLGDALRSTLTGWVPQGLGHAGSADLFTVLQGLLASAVGTDAAAWVVVVGSVAAGLSAWWAAGAASRVLAVRWWVAISWAVAPSLLAAIGSARVGAVVAHVAIPWVMLGAARAIGVDTRDSVSTVLPAPAVAAAVDEAPAGAASAADAPAGAASATDAPASAPSVGSVSEPTRDPEEAAPAARPARPDQTVAAGARPDHAVAAGGRQRGRRGHGGSAAAAAAAALALVVVVAGAPVLLAPATVLLLAAAVAAPRGRWRLALIPIPSVVMLGGLLLEAVGRGGQAVRLLADPGRPVPSDPAPAWRVLLGAGDGATPDVPTLVPSVLQDAWPLLVGGVALVIAVVALLRGGTAARGVRVLWLAAPVGVLTAWGASRVVVAGADGAAVTIWQGTGASVVLAGLLGAGAVGADGVRAWLERHTFGWRQVTVVVLSIVVLVLPTAAAASWALTSRTTGTDVAAGPSLVDDPVLPDVAGQVQASPTSSRVLVIDAQPNGTEPVVRWTLLRSRGATSAETAVAVTTAVVDGAISSPRAGAADPADTEVSTAVAALVSGATQDVSPSLAALGVGMVLLRASDDGGAPAEVVAAMDGAPGLARVTSTAAGVLWRVQGADGEPRTTSWARVAAPEVRSAVETSQDGTTAADGAAALLADAQAVGSSGDDVDETLPAGTAGGVLVLAERSDDGWQASLDGVGLTPVDLGWRQAFELPAGGGHLVVEHTSSPAWWLGVLQAVTLLVTVLLAFPRRWVRS